MDAFHAHHVDILDPTQQPRAIALLREHGLVTFTGITDRAALASAARTLMSIRPHRDAGPDGVTVITDTRTTDPGYAAFTDAELMPHTDGTSLPSPPGLLLLTCQQPASQGGNTMLADAARVTATLAGQHPDAFRALSAPRAAYFGIAGGYATPVIPLLRAVITQHLHTIQLRAGQGVLISNTRWLHGRDRYTGPRVMLRILGDPLPGTGIQPGFPAPSSGTQAARAA